MARRIEVFKPRSASEDEAQRLLARILPASWVITTNIKEHMFGGRRKPEIDSILITPLGLFVLDFKNYRGVITPTSNGAWGGTDETSGNPLEQVLDNMYPVKDLLKDHDERFEDIRLETLIVLTNENVELNWVASDVKTDARMHVSLIGEVEVKARQLAAATKITPLNPDLASKALEALKPVSIPNELFKGADWSEGKPRTESSVCARPSPESSTPQIEKPSAGANPTAGETRMKQLPEPSVAAKPVASELDGIVCKMIRWEDQQSFREYLRRFEDPRLLTRPPNEELSAAELERLRHAKTDFENRQGAANEINHVITEHIDLLACLSKEIYGLGELVSRQRTIEIVREYVLVLCQEDDGRTINRAIAASRSLKQAMSSSQRVSLRKQWRDFCNRTLAGTLLHKLDHGSMDDSGLRLSYIFPGVPLWFAADEQTIATAQDIIRKLQHPLARLVDRFILPPSIPWSSRRRAERLVRRVEKFCNADEMKQIRAQLDTIANILERSIGADNRLKAALLRESLTGVKLSVPLGHYPQN